MTKRRAVYLDVIYCSIVYDASFLPQTKPEINACFIEDGRDGAALLKRLVPGQAPEQAPEQQQ